MSATSDVDNVKKVLRELREILQSALDILEGKPASVRESAHAAQAVDRELQNES